MMLLRAGLYEAPELLEGFRRLSDAEWEELYAASKRQTVSGIIYHALSYLPEDLLPPYRLLLRWTARVHRIEQGYARMAGAIATLTRTFAAAPILQKGHAVARFYPQPQMRVCGDIDLYFPAARRRAADAAVAAKGIHIHHAPDGASVYSLDGIEVEHHSQLIELFSPRARRRLQSVESLPPVKITLPGDTQVLVPAPLTELLMINVHIMKHCLGMGIGLRHFCDYALAYRHLIARIGETRYMEECRRLGIARWTRTLHSFINEHLSAPGLAPLPVIPHSSFLTPHSPLTESILRLVLEGGNFGLYRRHTDDSAPALRRKRGTLRAFLANSRLALRLAPAETLASILRLLRGNLTPNRKV